MAVDDANTIVLLHMDGADASTSFVDESGKVWTAHGAAQLDTAQQKFGTASALFDNNAASYIDTPYHADFNLGGGDWTIDFWARLVDLTYHDFIEIGTSASQGIGVYYFNGNIVCMINLTALINIAPGISANTWAHIALVNVNTGGNNVIKLYIAGVLKQTSSSSALNPSISTSVKVGKVIHEGFGVNGWIDELRVSNVARWTADFTPPTSEYSGPPIVEIPAAGLTLTPHDPFILPIFADSAGLTLTPHAPAVAAKVSIPAAGLTLTPYPPTPAANASIPAAGLTLTAHPPTYLWSIPAAQRPAAQVIYKCYLTGENESPALADLELPISSFQATLRDGDPSYLACVVPNAIAYVDAIAARTNGEIVVKKGYRLADGTETLEEIARVTYESVREDRGGRNDSATIAGHKTVASSVVKTRAVSGLSYYGLQADGSRRLRADVDLFLRCGDTVEYDLAGVTESFVVGSISLAVSPVQATMEVAEVEQTPATPPGEPYVPPAETSQAYELVGPGVVKWIHDSYYYTDGGFSASPEIDGVAGVQVMSNAIDPANYSVSPVDPEGDPAITGTRGIECPIFIVPNGSVYAIGDPGGGATLTVAADYTVNGVLRTAYKSVVVSP